MMLGLSAFADEISPDLKEQIRVCRENGVTHIELRSVENTNVLDLTPKQRSEIRSRLKEAGIGVICIGSPIGKVKIGEPWPPHFDRFKRAVDAAAFFEAPLIRLFSYYPTNPGDDPAGWRDEVLVRMRSKIDYLRDAPGITLVHENERDIFGDTGARCTDLMRSINSPLLRTAFDFANFVQVGERPRDNWPALKPFTVHFHIKDSVLADKKIVPPGQGDGDIRLILADAWQSGYRGFLSLEPHLAAHGQFSGFSGPTLFKVAVDALKGICRDIGIPLRAK